MHSCELGVCGSGSQVQIAVNLEREDEDVSPHVIAPFFPQVSLLDVS